MWHDSVTRSGPFGAQGEPETTALLVRVVARSSILVGQAIVVVGATDPSHLGVNMSVCATGGEGVSESRRLLVIGGIALAVWGMSYGLWYAMFAEHQALDNIGGSLAGSFAAAAERNPAAMESSLRQYREAKYVYDRQVDVHGHWIGLAMLLIVLGIGFDRVGFSERRKLLLASSLLVGAVVFPLGVLLQTMSHGPFPRAVAVAGSVLMIGGLAGTALGAMRHAASPG